MKPPKRTPKTFNVFIDPNITCELIKKELERIAIAPTGVSMVKWTEETECFKIEVTDMDVYEGIRKRRHKSTIGGTTWYFVDEENLFYDVQIAIGSVLTSMAKNENGAVPPGLYDDVTLYPTAKMNAHRRLFTQDVTVFGANTWQAAVKFGSKLRDALFEFAMAPTMQELEHRPPPPPSTENADEDDGDDDENPAACTPVDNTKDIVEIRVRVSNHSYHCVRGRHDDVFRMNMNAVVLQAKPNLQLYDQQLETSMKKAVTDVYFSNRDRYLTTNPPIVDGDVIVIKDEAQKYVLVCVADDANEEVLWDGYYGAFECLNTMPKTNRVAVVPFSIHKCSSWNAAIRTADPIMLASATAAASAITYQAGLEQLRPTLIYFVWSGEHVARAFSKLLSAKFNDKDSSAKKLDETGKYDVAMSLPPKTAAAKANDDAAAAVAAGDWASIEVSEDAMKTAKKERVYGKRSVQEKHKHQATTIDERERFRYTTTSNFMRMLQRLFPESPDLCGMCQMSMALYGEEADPNDVDETEMCLRCYRTFHIRCLDEYYKGACPYCMALLIGKNSVTGVSNRVGGGSMEIDAMEDGETVPGYENSRGHIKITYSIPSGVQTFGHPKPGALCFGLHRVAYLPNTKDGARIAEMLRIAFERGLVFCIGKSLTCWDDYSVTWNCIPHKTRLDGGRANCGYPDSTYLTRLKFVLDTIGIDSMKPMAAEEEDDEVTM